MKNQPPQPPSSPETQPLHSSSPESRPRHSFSPASVPLANIDMESKSEEHKQPPRLTVTTPPQSPSSPVTRGLQSFPSASVPLGHFQSGKELEIKKRKLELGVHGADRLGALPDDLLRNIVLLLDTKDAVKTSVLAKRFKSTWQCIYNVQICDKGLRVINKVIGVLEKVDCFEFVITSLCSKGKLKVGLKLLEEKKVKKIFVTVENGSKGGIISYPGMIFRMESLDHLTLETPISWKLPKKITLPNLKSLEFNLTRCKYVDSINNLVKYCPMLLDLEVRINLLEANDHSSCHLKLESSSLRSILLCGAYTLKEVLLSCETPSLKYLDLDVPNIGAVPSDKIFRGLTVLDYLVTGIEKLPLLHSILKSCDLVKVLRIMFMVDKDPIIDWFLNFDMKNLRHLIMNGWLRIGKDRNVNISLRTPMLKELDINFKINVFNLRITWSVSCNLVWRRVCPAPMSEVLIEEKPEELQQENSEELEDTNSR